MARLRHRSEAWETETAQLRGTRAVLSKALHGRRSEMRARPGSRRQRGQVFLERPRTPMGDNLAERVLRGPVIGRRLWFGSDSKTGAQLAALLCSVVGTLNLNGIDVRRWLDAWLAAVARHGGRPSDDLAPWLPWSMDDARRREVAVPT